jgi:hypothetical protein
MAKAARSSGRGGVSIHALCGGDRPRRSPTAAAAVVIEIL